MDDPRAKDAKSSSAKNALLGPDDPAPAILAGRALAPGPFVLLGDHAGRAIPRALDGLGLPPKQLARHIAVDLGVRELGQALGERLQAPFLRQAYSRLVVDCNRHASDPGAIAETSDHVEIPGNRRLTEAHRRARMEAVYQPYHAAIAELLDARAAAALRTIIVSLHSFTPVMDGFVRPWELGVLHDGHEDGFALAVLERMRKDGRFTIGDNEPYRMDRTDYTVPRHAYTRRLRYIELEVRQDIAEPRCAELTEYLADVLTACA